LRIDLLSTKMLLGGLDQASLGSVPLVSSPPPSGTTLVQDSGRDHARARPHRALRAAELRFSRRYGLDWRMRADVEEIEAV
jgi:hypothetical protein